MSARRPSPALVLALIALFVALGGTGYAAVKVNGKNIKRATLTGKKVKKNTLTGTQVKESKLATVPRAKRASTAGAADTLSAAGAAAFLRSDKVLTTGLVRLAKVGNSPATSPRVPFFTKGPFSATARCFDAGAGLTRVEINLASSELNTDLGGVLGVTRDGAFARQSAGFVSGRNFEALATPSGATLAGAFTLGVNGLGGACFVSANVLSAP